MFRVLKLILSPGAQSAKFCALLLPLSVFFYSCQEKADQAIDNNKQEGNSKDLYSELKKMEDCDVFDSEKHQLSLDSMYFELGSENYSLSNRYAPVTDHRHFYFLNAENELLRYGRETDGDFFSLDGLISLPNEEPVTSVLPKNDSLILYTVRDGEGEELKLHNILNERSSELLLDNHFFWLTNSAKGLKLQSYNEYLIFPGEFEADHKAGHYYCQTVFNSNLERVSAGVDLGRLNTNNQFYPNYQRPLVSDMTDSGLLYVSYSSLDKVAVYKFDQGNFTLKKMICLPAIDQEYGPALTSEELGNLQNWRNGLIEGCYVYKIFADDEYVYRLIKLPQALKDEKTRVLNDEIFSGFILQKINLTTKSYSQKEFKANSYNMSNSFLMDGKIYLLKDVNEKNIVYHGF